MDREYILRQIHLIQRQCEINAKRSEEIGSDGFNTYVIMTCRNCDTEIRTDKEKIDKFFLERLVQDIEK